VEEKVEVKVGDWILVTYCADIPSSIYWKVCKVVDIDLKDTTGLPYREEGGGIMGLRGRMEFLQLL
jgi:hypothetical protein